LRSANESAEPATDHSAENEYVRVSVNDDGTVDVVDLRSGARYPRCGELEDVGDVGDEYNYSPPQGEDRRITSADAENVRIRHVENGPIRAEFRIDLTLRLPVSVTGDRTARAAETVANDVSVVVSLDTGSPRVGFAFSVENRAKDHRLRVLFPVGADSITEVRAETAFGVVTRPARRARPAEVRVEVPVSYGPTGGFTEAGGDTAGAIVFGEGLVEYEAYTDAPPARLALTLLRCVGFLSRDDLAMRPSGHAGPGLPTPGAQCLGRHQFRLGFEPRAKRPPASGLFARAGAFVAPPLVVPAVGGSGTLPPFDAFLAIDGRAVLSACHRAHDGDGTILRLFNPDATPTQMRVMRHGHGAEVIRVDFLERPRDGVAGRAASTVEIAPHQIATFRMV
jgi:alpha-mannosidase